MSLSGRACPLCWTGSLAERSPDVRFCAHHTASRTWGRSMRPRLTAARLTILPSAVLLALLPTAALAHPGLGDGHGFVHGLAHPLGGLDHLSAMVAVGLFAWQLSGRALVLVPATFVLAMA